MTSDMNFRLDGVTTSEIYGEKRELNMVTVVGARRELSATGKMKSGWTVHAGCVRHL